MNKILYIGNDYCSDIDELKHLFEIGVQNHDIRHEILGYYRDGVLSEWLQANGYNSIKLKNNIKGSNTDNNIYDKLYCCITNNSSIINSLKSKFSDYLQIVSVKFSDNGIHYIENPFLANKVCFVKIMLKTIIPENNKFVISINNQVTIEVNPSDYKRNQVFELIRTFNWDDGEFITIIEGHGNILYSAAIKPIYSNLAFFTNELFSEFKNYNIDQFPSTKSFNEIELKYNAKCNPLEQELLIYELTTVDVVLREYWRNPDLPCNFFGGTNSNIQCFVCLEGILNIWTTKNLEEGTKKSRPFFERSQDFIFTKQMKIVQDKYNPYRRLLIAPNNTTKEICQGNPPSYTTLKSFLEWYFKNMIHCDNAMQRV